ncbi:MAG: CDP-glucose 4,6-dehydratase, partial [Clostridia bacterium]|nr:CDP-glucose 4,6-dehydratase [Clostridia bacterium]
YQHVLEPLFAYLTIARAQYLDPAVAGCYNVGPDECDCVAAGELVDLFCRSWGEGAVRVDRVEVDAPHEAHFLKLDCSKIKSALGWRPRWHIDQAVEQTCRWAKVWQAGGDLSAECDREIDDYLS